MYISNQPKTCISQKIIKGIGVRHIVGEIDDNGIVTNNTGGVLLFGPYRELVKGIYTLEIDGKDYSEKGSKFTILITSNSGAKIIKKFEINHEGSEISILFDNIQMVSDEQLKIIVDEQTNIKIIQYKLSKKRSENEINNTNSLL